MAKASRSQFIEKLYGGSDSQSSSVLILFPYRHSLLETPFDGGSLRWTDAEPGHPGAFEITCDDRHARNALSPSWEFRS